MKLKFTLQTIGRRSLVEINVHAVEYRRARQLNQKMTGQTKRTKFGSLEEKEEEEEDFIDPEEDV